MQWRILGSLMVVLLVCTLPAWAQREREAAIRRAVLSADWPSVAAAARAWQQQEPGAVVAAWLLGYAGLATGDYRQALEGFQRLGAFQTPTQLRTWAAALVDHQPQNAIAHLLHGDALARLGDVAEARAALDRAVHLNPRAALIYNTRGVVNALADKPAEAQADFDRALALAPGLADVHANQGLLRLMQDQPAQAVAHFTAALEHAPAFALALNGRGIAALQLQDYASAVADLERARQHAAPDARGWIEANLQAVQQDQARAPREQPLAESPAARAMAFAYDAHGQLAGLTDTFGAETRYSYDPQGRLTRITYPDGKWTAYRYDAQGLLRDVRTEHGRQLRYTHGPGGAWTEIEFPNHDTLRITHEATAQRLTVAFPDGDTTSYHVDQDTRRVTVSTVPRTRTSTYEPSGHLRQVQWSDGRALTLQYDAATHLHSLIDHTGQEVRDWEVAVHADARGRITSLTDPLGHMQLHWDDAGRLTSAASDTGAKVLVRWDTATNTLRALTTSWGYVEFDAQGRPQDLYTLDGLRWPAAWSVAGHLDQVMTPLFGTLRLQYGASERPMAVQFPDGRHTALAWEQRSERAQRREPLRPLASTLREEDRTWQYHFPVPQVSADRVATLHSGRFWERVQEALARSARLPMSSAQEMRRHEAYWTTGEYWTQDPYYAELARPLPALSAEGYAQGLVLTIGIYAMDFGRFFAEVVPSRLVPVFANVWARLLASQGPMGPRRGLLEHLYTLDPNTAETVNRSSAPLRTIGSIAGAVGAIQSLAEAIDIYPWYRTARLTARAQETLLTFTPQAVEVQARRVTVELLSHAWGYSARINPWTAVTKAVEEVIHHKVAKQADALLVDPPLGSVTPPPGAAVQGQPQPASQKQQPARVASPPGPAALASSAQALTFRINHETGEITRLSEGAKHPVMAEGAPAPRKPSFLPQRSCGETDCPPPDSNTGRWFPPPGGRRPPPPPGGGPSASAQPPQPARSIGSSPPPPGGGPSAVAADGPARHPPWLPAAAADVSGGPPSLPNPSAPVSSGPGGRAVGSAPAGVLPAYRLPAGTLPSTDRSGVWMSADVYKNQPADTRGLFRGTPGTPPPAPRGTPRAAPQPAGLFTPFLLFCAGEGVP